MLTAGIGIVHFPFVEDLLGSELTVLTRQRQYAVTYMLNRTGLMRIDMAGNSAVNSLMRTQGGADNRQVGLGAANEKMYVSVRAGEGFSNQVTCFVAVGVKAVAVGLFHVGLHEFFKDCRMATFGVVTVETISHLQSPSIYKFYMCTWEFNYAKALLGERLLQKFQDVFTSCLKFSCLRIHITQAAGKRQRCPELPA